MFGRFARQGYALRGRAGRVAEPAGANGPEAGGAALLAAYEKRSERGACMYIFFG